MPLPRIGLPLAWIAALLSLAAQPARAELWEGLSLPLIGLILESDPSYQAALKEILGAPGVESRFSEGKENELKPQKSVKGKELGTLKFKHFYKGREVMGSQAFLHYGRGKKKARKEIRAFLARFDLDPKPMVLEREAIALARSYAGGSRVNVKPKIKILPDRKSDTAQLVYLIEVGGVIHGLDEGSVEVLLNAHTGAHIATLPREMNASPVTVTVKTARDQGVQVEPAYNDERKLVSCAVLGFDSGEKSTIDAPSCRALVKSACQALSGAGKPLSINPESCPTAALVSSDSSALRAMANGHAILDYFHDIHERNSYDNQGSPLVSVVHAGGALSNAYWSLGGKYLAYGEGDGVEMGDYTAALDIAGHEFTHAITQNDVQMVSIGETGALNEAYSDFFGKLIESRGDWTMGSSIALKPAARGLRDLSAPDRLMGEYFDSAGDLVTRPYPRRVADLAPIVAPCTERNDYCGIHYNTTVPSHAAYLIHARLGRERAQRLYYLTLTQFLTETSDFESAAQATLLACEKTLDPADCQQVRAAFSDVGML
jgi:Zn-dependent metalloprotease